MNKLVQLTQKYYIAFNQKKVQYFLSNDIWSPYFYHSVIDIQKIMKTYNDIDFIKDVYFNKKTEQIFYLFNSGVILHTSLLNLNKIGRLKENEKNIFNVDTISINDINY